MFTSELLEARQTEVPIRDIDEHAVDLLVNFCYTSEITIEESNVQTLLPAGEFLAYGLVQESTLQRQLLGLLLVCFTERY